MFLEVGVASTGLARRSTQGAGPSRCFLRRRVGLGCRVDSVGRGRRTGRCRAARGRCMSRGAAVSPKARSRSLLRTDRRLLGAAETCRAGSPLAFCILRLPIAATALDGVRGN